jgi:hypothetical protein
MKIPRRILSGILAGAAACVFAFAFSGCAPSEPIQTVHTVIQPPPLFPPQDAMQSGDYTGFLARNQEALKTCKEPEECAAALFNIGFLYCYSKSPYYNPTKGLKYLDDLCKGSPESPWSYQARIWIDMVKKNMKTEGRVRQLRDEVKSKESAAGEKRSNDSAADANRQAEEGAAADAARTVEVSGEGVQEPGRQRLEDEIRARDEKIRQLNRQLERSRQIDIEIDQKERGLLY